MIICVGTFDDDDDFDPYDEDIFDFFDMITMHQQIREISTAMMRMVGIGDILCLGGSSFEVAGMHTELQDNIGIIRITLEELYE
jgi:hypothetical protein